jgi:hypothetical protein
VRLFVVDTINKASGELRYTYPVGRITGYEAGSLILQSETGVDRPADLAGTLRVPVAHIGSAEVFTGMKRHAVRGAVIGLVVGGTVGFLSGEAGYGGGYDCYQVADSQFCGTSARHSDTRLRNSSLVGGLGALAGAAAGYFIRTERWSEVSIGQLRLQVGVR